MAPYLMHVQLMTQEMEVVIPDPLKVYSSSGMVESKSVGTFSPVQKQDGHRSLFVDRGVGSPRLVKSSSSSAFPSDLKLDTETKVCTEVNFLCEDYLKVILLFDRSGCSSKDCLFC